MHLLGVIAHQAGRNDVAVELIRQAIAIKPNFPEAYSNLGNSLKELGRPEEAAAAYRQSLGQRPGMAGTPEQPGQCSGGDGEGR